MDRDSARAYWRANRLLIAVLLAIWALVSFFFVILLAEPLYETRVGRLPMSFWWAQQGSMIVFVILIFVYARSMDAIDRRYDVHEEDEAELAVRRAEAEAREAAARLLDRTRPKPEIDTGSEKGR